jgi:DNA polymerase family A
MIEDDLVLRSLALLLRFAGEPKPKRAEVSIAGRRKELAMVAKPTSSPVTLPLVLDRFAEIWAVDFEFYCPSGRNPTPHCLAAREIRSHRCIRLWSDAFNSAPPFAIGPDSLFLAYAAAAEMRCHLVLGWPLPANVIDLFTESRLRLNFPGPERGRGSLLETLDRFGIPHIDPIEKKRLQKFAGQPEHGGEDREKILEYCQSDVDVLPELFAQLLPEMDIAKAMERGEYVKETARIEYRGVSVVVSDYEKIDRNREQIRLDLIAQSPVGPKIYADGHFKHEKFGDWLNRNEINEWDRTTCGRLALTEDYLQRVATVAPAVRPVLDLTLALKDFKKVPFGVGLDGRTHADQVPFGTVTGRNAPRRFILLAAKFWRWTIRAPKKSALIYCDYKNEEFAVAAFLSGDTNMIADYGLQDVYQTVAKQLGVTRKNAKVAMLATQYGAGPSRLAGSLNIPFDEAEKVFRYHKKTYADYWRWSDSMLDELKSKGIHRLDGDGWALRLNGESNGEDLLTARNFPIQGVGAAILRRVVLEAAKERFPIIATLHDAVLLEAPISNAKKIAARMSQLMRAMSREFLHGHEVRVDSRVYQDRFEDEDGKKDWKRVRKLLRKYPN